MSKYFNMNNWEKKIIFISVLFAIIVVLFARVRHEYVIPISQREPEIIFTNSNENNEIVSLGDVSRITQTIKGSYDGIGAINLHFTKQKEISEKQKAEITVQLLEKGKLIQSWEVTQSDFICDDWTTLKLDDELVGVADKEYTIKVDIVNADNIGIGVTKNDAYLEGQCQFDGSQYNGDLMLEIIGTSYRFLDKTVWCIGMVFIVYIILACTYIVFIKKIKVEQIFIILSIGLGLVYGIVFPPFLAPDESSHFVASVHVANEILGNSDEGEVIQDTTNNDGVFNRTMNVNSYRKIYNAMHCSSIEFYEFYDKQYDYIGHNQVLKLTHTVQACGILISKALHMNYIYTIYLVRILNLFIFTVLCFIAIKIIPFGKMGMLFAATLPMTMELACSVSYDAWINGWLYLYIAYILYLTYSKDKVTWKEIFLALMFLFLGAERKRVYYPLLILILMIPIKSLKCNQFILRIVQKNFGQLKKELTAKRLYIVGAVFALGLGIGSVMIVSYYRTIAEQNVLSPDDMYGVSYVIGYPVKTINVFLNTIVEHTDFYLNSLIGQRLGSLNVIVDSVYIYGFLLLLFLVGVKDKHASVLKGKNECLMISAILFTVLLVMSAMYAYATSASYNVIQGVQGRYFLPTVPLMLIVLHCIPINTIRDINKHMIICWLILHYLLLLNVLKVCFKN